MLKTRTAILSATMLFLALFAVTNTIHAQEATDKVYIKIQVDGLSCPFCAYGLEKNLKKVKGIKDIFISVQNGYTTFNISKETQPAEEKLKKIVKDAGFTAKEITILEKPFAKDEK
jgi:copper chaperone CopZ